MNKNNTSILTKKIQILPTGTPQEINTSWEKLNHYFDNAYKIANKVISTQHFIRLTAEEMVQQDKYSKVENEEVREQLAKIDNNEKGELNVIYERYGLLIEQFRGAAKGLKLDASEKEARDKELLAIKSSRNIETTAIRKKYNSEKKKYKSIIDNLNRKALLKFSDGMHTSIQNTTYQQSARCFEGIPSAITSAINAMAFAKYNNDHFEVVTGQKSLSNWKKTMPVPFMGANKLKFTVEENEKGDEYITFHFHDKINFALRFGADKSGNRSVIKKIIKGEYQLCDSELMMRKGKLFLNAAVRFPNKVTLLDYRKIVGVDLGINVPAYLCLNEGSAREAIGSREGFLKPLLRMQAQKSSLQKDLKFTNGGKGRKKKLKRLDTLEKGIGNWTRTANHKISKQVIDFALKNDCGVIQMEKLTGIAQDEKSKWILRNWTYFQLQTFIEYKAKVHGIEVRYINPAYTSQTCPNCKHISRENRKTQAQFECVKCKFKDNADWVGAYNIANSTDTVERKGAKLPPKKKIKAA